MTWKSGFIYEGQWISNKPEGTGVGRYVTGEVYEGSYRDGLKSGPGKQTNSDGSQMWGVWSGNYPHGKIRHVELDGTIFEGNYCYGFR